MLPQEKITQRLSQFSNNELIRLSGELDIFDDRKELKNYPFIQLLLGDDNKRLALLCGVLDLHSRCRVELTKRLEAFV